MATGKKQNGRCPFPKKAKFRAIQRWPPTVITIIETSSPALRFSFVKQIHLGSGGRKAWGLWQLTLDPGNGGIVSLPALQQPPLAQAQQHAGTCAHCGTWWYLVVLVNFGNYSPLSTMADLLALGCPCLCRGVQGCLWVSIRAPFLLMAARS